MNGLKMCECGEPTYTDKCELCWSDEYITKQPKQNYASMNKRIKELVNQAGTIEVCKEQDNGVIFEEVLNVEKFAELIVKECIKRVGYTDLEDVEGGDAEVLQAAKREIEHYFFGVNE